MSRYLRSRFFCIVLIAGGQAFLPPAPAKPPELPVDEKIECKEPPRPARRAGETAVPANVVIIDEQELPAQAHLAAAVPIDMVTPCLCELLDACARAMVGWFPAGPTARAATRIDFTVTTVELPRPFDCPYLQGRALSKDGCTDAVAQISGSVLENLEKLELAQELYKLGEHYRKLEKSRSAEHCFAQVRTLCPGSQWDLKAEKQVRELHAAQERNGAYRLGQASPPSIGAEESSVDEQPAGATPGARIPTTSKDLQMEFRNLVEVLQGAADFEVDLSAQATRRMQCEVHVGGVMYKMVMDEQGNLHFSRQMLTGK